MYKNTAFLNHHQANILNAALIYKNVTPVLSS